MTSPTSVVHWTADASRKKLIPTTLDKLGKNEDFLETIIAAEPDLLGLENRRSGIRGPFCVLRQLPLPTPTGKTIYPDIVILTASGHVVVVEVKLRSNSELLNRSVIAQIVDYAASFAALDDAQMLAMISSKSDYPTWSDCITAQFPSEADTDELAAVLRDRMQSGQINLVIACDSAPARLSDVIAGIASQSTLGFDLDLVEITPFVTDIEDKSEIVFVPARRLATEIVARTAVTISYRVDDEQPSTHVETTAIEEIEQNLRSVAQSPPARVWSSAEVDAAFQEVDNHVQMELLEFAKKQSFDGQWLSSAPKHSAAFGFGVPVRWKGSPRTRMAFYCACDRKYVVLSLERIYRFAPSEVYTEYTARLKAVFGSSIDIAGKEPCIKLDAMSQHLDAFRQLMLWLKSEMEQSAANSAKTLT